MSALFYVTGVMHISYTVAKSLLFVFTRYKIYLISSARKNVKGLFFFSRILLTFGTIQLYFIFFFLKQQARFISLCLDHARSKSFHIGQDELIMLENVIF